MSELLPCPFCGGSAEVERVGTSRVSCVVSCEDCGARVDSNENGAGAYWNMRTHTSALAEVERLQKMLDACAVTHEYNVKLKGDRDELRAEVERLRAAMNKVNAIRNSIVGCQRVNISEHIYPLVAALNEAGFTGESYEVARENLGTLLERTNKAEAEVEQLRVERDALRAAHRDALEVLATVAQVNGYHAREPFPRAITTANRFMAAVEEVGKLRARADAAEADADRAVLALAGMVEAYGVNHADECSSDDDCCCGVRERWLWLTNERVELAERRAAVRNGQEGGN